MPRVLVFAALVLGLAVPPERTAQSPATKRMAEYLARLAPEAEREILKRMPNPDLYTHQRSSLAPSEAEFVDAIGRAYEQLTLGRSTVAAEQFAAIEETAPERSNVKPELIRLVKRLRAAACLRAAEDARDGEGEAAMWVLPVVRHTANATAEDYFRQAIHEYESLLADDATDLSSRWLLNLAVAQGGLSASYHKRESLLPESAMASERPFVKFRDVSDRIPGAITGRAGGCVLDDIDGDGLIDIVISSVGLNAARNQLKYFHNEGRGRFVDRTIEAGLEGIAGGINLISGDYDNDGRIDIFVPRGAWLGDAGRQPASLLHNLGGRFEDVSEAAGTVILAPATTAAWADFDNDGWLDLFVGTETSPNDSSPNPSQLLRNNHDGTFSDVAPSAGLDAVGWIKGACWGDYDNDGWPDLYVSRLFETNLLFHNEKGKGRPRLREVSVQAGVQKPLNSYACAFFDMDNDGWLDLLAASTSSGDFESDTALAAAEALGHRTATGTPKFYRNLGNGMFADETERVRLDRAISSMGMNVGDIDNDGWPDLYFGTGNPMFDALLPNRMFRNDDGRAFQEVTSAGGFGLLAKGHAIAFADLDNDGDQDIVAVLGGVYPGDVHRRVLLENPGGSNHWITLRLQGTTANRLAIGARITIVAAPSNGVPRTIHALTSTGGSFGASSVQQEIGLGDAKGPVDITVTWPGSRRVDRHRAVPIDRIVQLVEGRSNRW